MKVKFNDIAINCVAKKKPVPEDATHYIGLEHIDSGSFEITRWGSEVAPIGDKLLMKKGDLLFGRRRAYQRKVAIAPFDGIFSAHGMVLRPKTDVVDPGYFPFFIASDQFMDEAVRISVGGLSPTINWKTLKECEFDLPPLARQKELAELLWAANDLKEKYKKMIVATDEMLKAKFREMFGDDKQVTALCASKQLQELADVISGITKGRKLKPGSIVKDVPYMAVSNVKDGYIDWTTVKVIAATEEEITRYKILRDDILLAEGGDPDKVGRGSIVKNVPDNCIHQNHIFRVRTLGDWLDPDYFALYLQSPRAKKYFLRCAKQTTGIASINMTQLKALPVTLPPLALQRQFVEIARKADETKAALKKSIADVESVIKGLING